MVDLWNWVLFWLLVAKNQEVEGIELQEFGSWNAECGKLEKR
jgi:hypothetical protein